MIEAVRFLLTCALKNEDTDVSTRAKRHLEIFEAEVQDYVAVKNRLPHDGRQSPQERQFGEGLGDKRSEGNFGRKPGAPVAFG